MAKETGISWCDSTANLWIGCTRVSPACGDESGGGCYAEALMGGLGETVKPPGERRMGRVAWGPHGDRSYCKQGWIDLRKWQRAAERNGGLDPELGRKRFVFINSLSDFLDNHRSVIWRPEAWALFRECTHLILIIVTKRPQLIERELPEFWDEIADRIILLTTAENQQWADIRIPQLLRSTGDRRPAAIYGASFEPLLGPIKLRRSWLPCPKCEGRGWYLENFADNHRTACSECLDAAREAGVDIPRGMMAKPGPRLGWGIIGGESGSRARIMHPSWAADLIEQLIDARVPVQFKQWGEFKPYEGEGGIEGFWFDPNGHVYGSPTSWPPKEAEPRSYMIRVGTKRAGHLIGGRELLERPAL